MDKALHFAAGLAFTVQANVILRQGAFSAGEEDDIRAWWAERYLA